MRARDLGKAGICYRLLCALGAFLIAQAAFAAPTLVDFGPKDMHREVRQISMRFSEDVVALGDSKAVDAAQVTCKGFGTLPLGHWIDSRRWVAEFSTPLPDGVICTVVPAALKTLKGESLPVSAPWTFNTGGPRVVERRVATGNAGLAKEAPIVALRISAPLEESSLKNLRCEVNGKERDVRWLALAEREAAFKATGVVNITPDWLVMRCGEKDWPADAKINLVWPRTIKTDIGLQNEADEEFHLQVRPAFSAKFSCEELLGTSGCDVRREVYPAVTLSFSEDVPKAAFKSISLLGSSGTTYPVANVWSEKAHEFRFENNFNDEKSLKVVLAGDLADVDGRKLTNRADFDKAFAVAQLPAYVGMPNTYGLLQWTPGHNASWPVATRNTEAELQVRAWHLSPQSDPKTLLTLQILSYSGGRAWSEFLGTKSKEPSTLDLTQPFAASEAFVTALSQTQGSTVSVTASSVRPSTSNMSFTGLPLAGYGTWIVEVDSPAFRAMLDVQRKELIKHGVIDSDDPDALTVHLSTDRVIAFDGKAYRMDGGLDAALDEAMARRDKTSAISVHAANIHAEMPIDSEVVNTLVKKLAEHGYTVVSRHMAPSMDAGAFNLRSNAAVRSWLDSRFAIVQLTNLDVHLALSAMGDSLVWVTAFDTGLPVPNAAVALWSDGALLRTMTTDQDGRVLIHAGGIGFDVRQARWVRVQAGEDSVIMPGNGAYLQDSNRPQVTTILDRTLFHAGETVSMQHLVRFPTIDGWSMPADGEEWALKIYRQWEQRPVYESTFTFNAQGSADNGWRIPESVALGEYRFTIESKKYPNAGRGSFQIEEFRVPLFEAELKAEASWKEEVQNLQFPMHLAYLAGGNAAGQALTLSGKYRYGANVPDRRYQFYRDDWRDAKVPEFANMAVTLDQVGSGKPAVAAPKSEWPLTLQAEIQFPDPNGEVQSINKSVEVWPHPYKLGLRVETETNRTEKHNAEKILVVLFDEKNRPLAKKIVTVEAVAKDGKHYPVCRVETDAAGKAQCVPSHENDKETADGAIEARAEHSSTVVVPAQTFAWPSREQTVQHVVLELVGGAPRIGENMKVMIRPPFVPATMLMTVEREGILHSVVRVLRSKEEIIELPTYRNYVPSVSVQAQFVRGTEDFAVVQTDAGKNGESQSGALKAEGRLRVSESLPVQFDESSARLKVEVTPHDKDVLPGTVLPVAIKLVRESDGKAASGAHVTVVAVDEGLLALKGNPTWEIFKPFWKLRETELSDFDADISWYGGNLFDRAASYFPNVELFLHGSALLQSGQRFGNAPPPPMASARFADGPVTESVIVTGIRASLQKDAESSNDTPRTNFSSLAFWKTDVIADGKGEVHVQIPMPDSLTRWRIVAIATQGTDRFGTGQANVVTSKPVQILSGLPQTVRSDDVLTQKVTLRNAGTKPVTLNLSGEAQATQDADDAYAFIKAPEQALAARGLKFSRRLNLAAGENRVVEWQSTVPDGVSALEWHIAVRDGMGKSLDALVVRQAVVPAVPVTVRDASLLQVDGSKTVPVAQPAGAQPGRGGVSVQWKASLVDAALSGARRWMAQYPYTCMEQLSSKAAISGDAAQWRAVMDKLPKMLDERGLVRYFPETPGSDILTAYLLDLADAYALEIPAAEKARMQKGVGVALQQQVDQAEVQWLGKDGDIARRLALQAAIARNLGKVAPILPGELDELPTIALLDWTRYLLAQPNTPQRKALLDKAEDHVRDRFDMQGTRLTLRHGPQDNNWWLMWNGDVSEARAALLIQRAWGNDPRWKDLIPSLAASVADRQRNGHWATTVANAWSAAALQEFARSAEKIKVDGNSSATLGADVKRVSWDQGAPSPTLLPWPQQGARADLTLQHEGKGQPWAAVQIRAAVRLEQAVSHGVAVQKTITPVQQKIKGQWSVGDIMSVALEMTSDADLSWLAVRDPIPSGATIMGKGLGGESVLAQRSGGQWWWNPSSVELGSESYRGYYQHIWGGKWQVTYLVRLNNAGVFTFPATRIEAMYAPEIFGESPNAVLNVGP